MLSYSAIYDLAWRFSIGVPWPTGGGLQRAASEMAGANFCFTLSGKIKNKFSNLTMKTTTSIRHTFPSVSTIHIYTSC